jgi:hypothetical protein
MVCSFILFCVFYCALYSVSSIERDLTLASREVHFWIIGWIKLYSFSLKTDTMVLISLSTLMLRCSLQSVWQSALETWLTVRGLWILSIYSNWKELLAYEAGMPYYWAGMWAELVLVFKYLFFKSMDPAILVFRDSNPEFLWDWLADIFYSWDLLVVTMDFKSGLLLES